MKKLLFAAIAATTIGLSALGATPASAALTADPLAPSKSAQTQTAKTDFVQVARRGGGGGGFRGGMRGGGFRGGLRHGGFRGHRFHRGHRHSRWGYGYGYAPVYYGGCYVRTVWTDWGPVRKRFCY